MITPKNAVPPREAARTGQGLERLRITSERKPSKGGWAGWVVFGVATVTAVGGGILVSQGKTALPWSLRTAAASPETTVVVPRETRSQDQVTAGGYAVTQSKVHLGSELTGKLKRIAVDKGDRIKAGDLVAELENESYRIEMTKGSKADLGMAKANAERCGRNHGRLLQLFGRGAISKDELEEARRLADTGGLSYEVAKARSEGAACEYNKTFIRSPLSGFVAKKFLNVGGTVSPLTPYIENMDTLCTGTPIVSLVDPSDVKVEVDVSEESIGKVKLGQSAEVTATVHPEARLKAEVCRIAVEANRKKHSIQVELRLKEPVPEYLKPEVEVKATIFCDGAECSAGELLLDRRAVLQRGEASFVYVVDHGRAVLRSVELGRGGDSHFHVTRGVREGESLILHPGQDWPEVVALGR